MMHTNIEEEISEYDWRPYEAREDKNNEDDNSLAVSKRGAKKIPE